MATCDRCGRPAWEPHGGMGGHIAPDYETHCIQRGGQWCRVAAIGAGRERARIVALLRSIADQYDVGDGVPCDDYYAEAYRDAADTIESAAHLRDGGPHD